MPNFPSSSTNPTLETVILTPAHLSFTPSELYAKNTEHEFYPNAVPELANQQVILHAYTEAEIPNLIPLLQDQQTNRWLSRALPDAQACHEDLLGAIRSYTNPQPEVVHLEWCIYRASDGKPVGFIYLEWNKGEVYEAEVGYLLASAHWNHGYATAAVKLVRDFAFLEMGIGKLTARCAWNNVASISVLTKVGMSHERSPSLEATLQGQQVDAYIMGMTRAEYAALQLQHQLHVPVSTTGLVTPASPRAQRLREYIQTHQRQAYVSQRIHHLGTRTLTTARLRLAPIGPQHAQEAFDNWLSDDRVSRFVTYPTYTNVEQVVEKFTSFAAAYANPDTYFWGVFRQEDNALIGTISLRINSSPTLDIGVPGYSLGRGYWGQGYATEAMHEVLRFAFTEIGLPVLQICHVTANSASANVILKTGFRFIGLQRSKPHVVFGMQDVMYYELLATDYFTQHPELTSPPLPSTTA